ncbi:MAG: quinoprotein relay system zinc metallohydrolase 1 [Burkholderiales bacterium]|jgi:uncharacterized sulfatase|nr:quinoprotein relay system zinc metallohydrolase 1 [Burkholderiales bacterium]
MTRAALRAVLVAALLHAIPAHCADAWDYALQPQEIAPDTWVFVGRAEDFTFANGGNVVNTGFVITAAGVVVIDTGPTVRYGQQMRAAIRRLTPLPVVRVFNTHHHPDHVLGNAVFAASTVEATAEAAAALRAEGAGFVDNMFRLVRQWATGTEVAVPTRVAVDGPITIGGHTFELHRMRGHTDGDLVIVDRTTGVAFVGDLVFDGRAPTTPHAHPDDWRAALATLRRWPVSVWVPGHGPPSRGTDAIDATHAWIDWLDAHLRTAAASGRDITEVLRDPVPARFATWGVVDAEYARSVLQRFPALERAELKRADAR